VSLCKGASDVITLVGNLTIESDVVRVIEKTIEHYKQLDVLVRTSATHFDNISECYATLTYYNLQPMSNQTH